MKIRRSVLKDSVDVETYVGGGGTGPGYAASIRIACNVDPTRKLVRKSVEQEVVSDLRLLIHPNDEDYFLPDSRVTYQGRVSYVVTADENMVRDYIFSVEVTCA